MSARQQMKAHAKSIACALLSMAASAAAVAADETRSELPPTLDASTAKVVVISLVGSKALKVTRRFEQANDANSAYGANTGSRAYNESPTTRSAEFAIAFSKIKGQAQPELTAVQSVDWVASANMALGTDRAIELEVARVIKANLPNATLGFVSRGKDRLRRSAENLPSEAAVNKVAADLKLLAEIAPADRYIVITPYLSEDWTGLGGAATSGIGWFVNRGAHFVDITDPEADLDMLDTHLASFIYLRTSVFDGNTFALLDSNTTTVNRKLAMTKAGDGFDPWSGTSEADRNKLLKGLMADSLKRIAKRALGYDPNIEIGDIKLVPPTAVIAPGK